MDRGCWPLLVDGKPYAASLSVPFAEVLSGDEEMLDAESIYARSVLQEVSE